MGRGTNDRLTSWRDARRELRAARDGLAEAEAAAGLRHTMGRRARMLLPVIGVVALIVAGIGVWFGVSAPQQYSDEDYLTAATSRVGLLLNVDSDDPARAEKILAGATGPFEAAFAQSADAYTTYVKDAGAHGKGSVDAAAVAYRSPEGADVLVAASLQVRNRDSSGAESDDPVQTLRLVVSMVPVDGQLKIERLVRVP